MLRMEAYNASAVKVEDLQFIQDGPTLGFMVMYIVIVASTIVLTPLIPKVGKRIPASLHSSAVLCRPRFSTAYELWSYI